MTKLQNLASQLGGSIVDVKSSERCLTHGVTLASQKLTTTAGSVHVGTICPFASRDECDHQESVVHAL